jgi:hypothetical protein
MTREEKAEIALAIRDDLPRHCPHLLRTLAFREAVKITKRAIAARGLKLYDFSSAEIHKLAERYLTLHSAELVAEVIEIVRGDAGNSLSRKPNEGEGIGPSLRSQRSHP